ncbi:hypothetical protein BD414DRAFT_538857 [Trametes punicea]|nr:hypothetical protein BD414DRAFT_538857 [Trametes punicea]
MVVDDTDIVYGLYRDSLEHLRTQYPPDLLDYSILDCLVHIGTTLADVPQAISTLANLLADISLPSSQSDLASHFSYAQAKLASFPPTSAIHFVLAGLRLHDALKISSPEDGHIVTRVKASLGDTNKDDLYQAFFLDYLRMLISWEHNWRALIVKQWSPMPWSHQSLEEWSAWLSLNPKPAFKQITHIPDEISSLASKERYTLGFPLDLPWLGASHDGQPSCLNLGSYTGIRCSNGNILSLRSDVALWLSAMTFGLFEAATDYSIPESLFLVRGTAEGDMILSGARILEFLVFWDRTCGHPAVGVASNWFNRGQEVAHLLQRAIGALEEEWFDASSVCFRAGLSQVERFKIVGPVTLAVAALCDTATRIWANAVIPEMNELREFLSGTGSHGKVADFATFACKRIMWEAGWCRNLLENVEFAKWPKVYTHLSNLSQLPPYIRASTDEHKRCTESSCVFYNLKGVTYVPRHVDPSCHCDYTKPLLQDIHDLLSNGLIPVVAYDETHLRVLPSNATPYVAISHVWAEGMGSTSDEGLPTCTVARIANCARRLLPETGAFWMDSLCVPKESSLRKLSIKLMTDIYRDAAKVLVIDESVRKQCSESNPWEQNCLRIAVSAWVRRVWTLQEGLLARQLYFEFIEGPVSVDPWGADRVLTVPADHRDGQTLDLVSVLAFRAEKRGNLKIGRFAEVPKLLQKRTASHAEDELIAISWLLPKQISIDDLLAEPDGPDLAERRMRLFFLQSREIPKVVPLGRSPRLTQPGFSWAPRTLTIHPPALWDEKTYGTGVCTEDGLVAEYFVAPLTMPEGVTLPDPSKGDELWTNVTRIQHRASDTVYDFNWTSLHPWAPVDTLLFLSPCLPAGVSTGDEPLLCIAACRVPSAGPRGPEEARGISQDAPELYRYAGAPDFRRAHPLAEECVRRGEMPAGLVGELHKVWVKLA